MKGWYTIMFNESIKMAIDGMVSNKLRTLLTLLGIIIGVGAVIAMVSLGFGVKEQIKENISRLGSNLLIVQSGGRTATGARIQAGSGARLTYDDAKAIEKNIDGIKYVAPIVSRGYQLVVGNQNWTTNVQGSTPNIIDIRDYTVEEGRNMSDHDMAGKDSVCVIGKTIVDNLFPEGDPVGKTIRINLAPFKVIGVLGAKGQSSGGQDQDDVVFVPLTTAQNRMMGITYVNNITIQAENENVIDNVQAEVENLLRTRHRIKNSDDDDFTVRNLAALMDTMMSTANTITMLLGCIAAISLLVGGIGIMNIMLVSVTERTREIGIRKALGATYNNILLQFLIESAVIGIIGGFLGVVLGIGASYAISAFAEWKTVISVPIIIIAVVFSVGIGVFFGIYPARKAALLDPIEALRYE
jgi:putative ABC transport system permease protein